VVFAYAVFKSHKYRDVTNNKIMSDPRIAAMGGEGRAIIDCKRMAYGGFGCSLTPEAFYSGYLCLTELKFGGQV
jgi:uncharacterized protein YbaA (DUF1428 family)